MSLVRRSNLVIALEYAIDLRMKEERDVLGYSCDSSLLAGWKKLHEDIVKGESVTIRDA